MPDVVRLVVPPLDANCWIVRAGSCAEVAVIDPGGAAGRIVDAAADARIAAILLTHGHFDHMTAAAELAIASGAPICAHQADAQLLANPKAQMPGVVEPSVAGVRELRAIADGDEVEAGAMRFSVLETPGHSPGGVCYLTEVGVFTGDTLFAGGIGRSDLPGGDHEQLLVSIRDKLLPLPDETPLYPGHGPSSTIGQERTGNVWLAGIYC